MTASCNHSESLARLSRRIDSLQSGLAEEKAASAEKLRQIFLAIDHGNKLAEGKRPAVKAEPESARVYQFPVRTA